MSEAYFYRRKNKTLQKKKLLSIEVQKVYRSLFIVIVVILLFLGTTMLAIGSQKNAKGYILRELQIKNNNLTSQNKTLDTKITKYRTLETIQNSEKTEQMKSTAENSENLTFVDEESSLAARQP